jgi:hypothetical protein
MSSRAVFLKVFQEPKFIARNPLLEKLAVRFMVIRIPYSAYGSVNVRKIMLPWSLLDEQFYTSKEAAQGLQQ